MARNFLTLRDLDRQSIARIDRELGLRLDGSALASTTAYRMRIVARACVSAMLASTSR